MGVIYALVSERIVKRHLRRCEIALKWFSDVNQGILYNTISIISLASAPLRCCWTSSRIKRSIHC